MIADDLEGLMYGIVTLSGPLAISFFIGASVTLSNAFIELLNRFGFSRAGVTTDEWIFGLVLLIPGVIGGAILWRALNAIARGFIRVSIPGRIYASMFVVITIVSLIGDVALLVTNLLDKPLDPLNSFSVRFLAILIIAAPFARYYSNILRRR